MTKPTRDMRLGARLRDARAAAGMTLREVATALGTHHVTICYMEQGSRNVRALELVDMAALYKVPTSRLLEGL